jgi:hypothetical protein
VRLRSRDLNVLPLQADRLRDPDAGCRQQGEERAPARVDGVEEAGELLASHRLDRLVVLDVRRAGGDTIAARLMYHEFFEFAPRFKLWLAANHRPALKASDDAMWRRIVQIPFTHTVPEDDRDPTLKDRFRTDPEIRVAVLAWAVRGCLAWQQQGLAIPDRVRHCTSEYRRENDPVAAGSPTNAISRRTLDRG